MQSIWDVYLNGKLINTVFYDVSCDEEYVKFTLIHHDGFPANIEVVKR